MKQKKNFKSQVKEYFKKFTALEKIFIVIILVLFLVCFGLINELYIKNVNSIDENTPVPPPPINDVIEYNLNYDNALSIHFIDVGQGESIFIVFPDNKNMLIDAGSGSLVSGSYIDNYLTYFEQFNIDTINYLLLTHAHSDHYNILTGVIEEFTIETFYLNDYPLDDKGASYKSFYNAVMAEEGADYIFFGEEGGIYTIESDEGAQYPYQVSIYAPGYNNPAEYFVNSDNSSSPMITLEYGGRRVLLTGDATESTERYFKEIIQDTLSVNQYIVDFLKVAHHGSDTSTKADFLAFTFPKFALISCGEVNTYNHPSAMVMNRLFNEGVITYRTNRHGTIVLYIDFEGNILFIPQFKLSVENNRFNRKTYMFID